MTTSSDRMVAGLVGGRYEITGLIAEGGMGSVYRARDTVLDRTVALKVLKAGGGDADFARSFKAEATNAARLGHPNIVQVYDFGYQEGAPYMAMEFVDGQSLREILTQHGVVRPEVAARIASQVANALEHARKAGIVHRDVKPENILITTEGRVKMADFGLSRVLAESRATQAEVLMGTAHYLAPEQVEGHGADHRSDLYSLGVVLYEMLTGRTPFAGDTPVAIAYKRVAEDVPSAMGVNPSVPRELDEVVARATARRPHARYASAGEMVGALRAAVPRFDTGELGTLVHHTEAIPLLGQETIAVPKQGARERRRRHRKRRWALIGLVLSLVAATVYAGTNRFVPVKVPNVEGMEQRAAVVALRAKGFDVETSLQNSLKVEANLVIAQDPPGNRDARKGSTVYLTISSGPSIIAVPMVRNTRYSAAEKLLKSKGFKVNRVDVYHEDVKRLYVISQDPTAGDSALQDSTVTLTVSRGPELVAVPNVVGDPEDSAAQDLEQLGFKVVVEMKNDDAVPKGEVISQNPKPGVKAKKGSEVKLVVSKGPPLVAAPNIICMTRKQAQDAAAAVGLEVAFEGPGRRVVDQDPPKGEQVPKGSTMTAFTGPGTFC